MALMTALFALPVSSFSEALVVSGNIDSLFMRVYACSIRRFPFHTLRFIIKDGSLDFQQQ